MKHPEMFKEEVEAIKLALGTIHYSGGSVKKTVVLCLQKYIEFFKMSGDEVYLQNALLYMQAFFEMGFTYEELPEMFDFILTEAGTSRDEMFPKRYYNANKIKLVRSQIRSMIHRWSPSKYHTMSIGEVVDDIILKVKERKKGHYFYHSNKNPKHQEDDDIYELV